MCYCCCMTRKGIIIYMMVVSVIAFIYGIVSISYFGSSTKIYKAFKEKIDSIKSSGGSSSSSSTSSTSRNNGYGYGYGYDYLRKLYPYDNGYSNTYSYSNIYTNKEYQELAKSILDSISLNYINDLNSTQSYSTSVIGSLKGIENGLGVILFIFTIIFLAVEIVFLVFSFGNKEFTPMPETTYKIFYVIKTVCLALSIIFVFLSILYGNLLAVALYQYLYIIPNTDSCVIGIIVGMVYGYYSFWYYITISCGFSKERTLFIGVGSVDNPGTGAMFDANGNPIATVAQKVPVQENQPITYSNVQQSNNMAVPINQTQNTYQALSINSKDDDLIFYNGMIYKKVGNAKAITSADINNIPKVVNNVKPNDGQNAEINVKQSQPPATNEKVN